MCPWPLLPSLLETLIWTLSLDTLVLFILLICFVALYCRQVPSHNVRLSPSVSFYGHSSLWARHEAAFSMADTGQGGPEPGTEGQQRPAKRRLSFWRGYNGPENQAPQPWKKNEFSGCMSAGRTSRLADAGENSF